MCPFYLKCGWNGATSTWGRINLFLRQCCDGLMKMQLLHYSNGRWNRNTFYLNSVLKQSNPSILSNSITSTDNYLHSSIHRRCIFIFKWYVTKFYFKSISTDMINYGSVFTQVWRSDYSVGNRNTILEATCMTNFMTARIISPALHECKLAHSLMLEKYS